MKIASLGCGSIGRRHLHNLHSAGWVQLFAFDPVPEHHREIAEELKIDSSENLSDVWSFAPDVVFVNSPSNFHVQQALDAANRGCHLFVEKPLAHSLEGLDQLQATAQDIVTMVGCNMRFHPGPVQIKRWVDNGEVGDVLGARIHSGSYLPRWRPHQDYRKSYSASPDWGGAVLDCIHELDLAIWLLGDAKLAAAVTRPAKSLSLATDGLAEIILEHAGGLVSSVHLNFVQRNYHRSIEIMGSEGTITWDFNLPYVNRYGQDGTLTEEYPLPEGWRVNQMYEDELHYFMNCVQQKEPTFNDISFAAKTLAIALETRGKYE